MNMKNQKGVTMVAEVLTIVIFMLLIGTITYSSFSSFQVRELNDMYSDILTIQEKAANYYLKYGEAPVKSDEKIDINTLGTVLNQLNPQDDENEYYKVDFEKLLNVSLNNEQTDKEYYIINAATLTVYYIPGVEIDSLMIRSVNETGNSVYSEGEEIYHTLPTNYTGITKHYVSDYQ